MANRRSERPAVADTSGAAIADKVKADSVEIVLQTRLHQIVGHHLAPRREGGLDPWLGRKALFDRLLCHQPSRDHHVRVRGVGAACDCRDHDVAVANIVVFALDCHARRLASFVNLGEVLVEELIHLREGDTVLRPFGASKARHHAGHVELERFRENRLVGGVKPQALFFGVGFNQSKALFRAARQTHVLESLVVDAKETAGRTVLWRHIGDSRAVSEGEPCNAFAVEFDKAAHHAHFAQHFHTGKHKVGCGDTFGHFAGEFEAHNFRDQHRDRLAQHRCFCLDPANAPAKNAKTVDHGGVAVGSNTGVGIGDKIAILVRARPHTAADIFKVHLVADACAWGNSCEILERFGAPFEEVIALCVSLVFEAHVGFHRLRVAKFIDHDRVVDHEVDGHLRVNLGCVSAKRLDRIAHRGEVDDARDAGKVLKEHARRAVLDLFARDGIVLPIDDALDIFASNREAAILKAQHVLQQHLHRNRQFRDITQLLGRLGERIIGVCFSADFKS